MPPHLLPSLPLSVCRVILFALIRGKKVNIFFPWTHCPLPQPLSMVDELHQKTRTFTPVCTQYLDGIEDSTLPIHLTNIPWSCYPEAETATTLPCPNTLWDPSTFYVCGQTP